ncbi:MAG: molecular chaperone TorD family protein [Eggerthellaceae bacterium]|nr:molecular chaperone TorD family protein [Eggerthellaceae bacterium]
MSESGACAGIGEGRLRHLRFTSETVEPIRISGLCAQAFADCYGFLTLACKLPSPGLFATLVSGELVKALGGMADDLSGRGDGALAKAALASFAAAQARVHEGFSHADLRAHYTELFTSPAGPRLMAHEALFLYYRDNPDATPGFAPRMFVNNAALSVERIFKEAGLARNPESNESADNIATEAELLSRLFAAKAQMRGEAEQAASGGDSAGEGEGELALDAVIREFTFYHVTKWHRDFFAAVEAEGIDEFFTGVGAWGRYLTGIAASL